VRETGETVKNIQGEEERGRKTLKTKKLGVKRGQTKQTLFQASNRKRKALSSKR